MNQKDDLLQKVRYSPLARMLTIEDTSEMPPLKTILDTFEPIPLEDGVVVQGG